MSKILLSVLLVALLAGCAQPAAPQANPTDGSTAAAPAPTGSVTLETDDNETPVGRIEGTVLDDETRPVPEARVAIPGLRVEVSTAEDGRYQFENVPAGLQVLSATAPGHDPQAKTIEVRPDEATTLNFVLLPAPTGPRYVALAHTFFIHVGVFGTSLAGGDTASCEKCEWIPKIDPGPSHVVLEINGKHTVRHPTRPDGLAVFLYKNGHSTAFSGCNWTQANIDPPCLRLPMRREFNSTELRSAVPADKPMEIIRMWQWCDPFWACVEERYDEWLTLFYGTEGAAIPADYSAWPK